MASLNTSTNGVSISRTHQIIVDAPLPASASVSPTYAQWAVFSVQAPLANAFQPDSSKESVLKVQSSGDGELADFIDEFSDGRMQFGFAKVKDPNTGLPKNVMIGWCGEGVPERNKGYFTSHMEIVSKLLQGYHVQITARNESNLTPEGIVKKVADSSGSKYTGDVAKPSAASGPPPVASKPVFTPSRVGGGPASFNPLASQPARPLAAADSNDGWGDAADVSRSTLQPVQSAYKPTKVDIAALTSQRQESRFQAPEPQSTPGVVKGGYQPIGKVDINAIRKQAAESGNTADDRPTIVKGAYEPVGKVDIAAIRAKAAAAPPSRAPAPDQGESEAADDRPKSLAERSAAFSSSGADSERITSMPKPKVANRFGAASSFAGTKAPLPGATGGAPPSVAPIGAASRTFADQGGKTPAQLWAEKKAQQGGSVPVPLASKPAAPVESQSSGGWQSGYTGKKWGAVDTVKTGGTASAQDPPQNEQSNEPEPEPEQEVSAGFGSIRDRFKDTAPIGAAPPSNNFSAPPPPALDTLSKPNASRGVPMPGLPTRAVPQPEEETQAPAMPPPPAQPPRSPSPPSSVEPDSPIRIAQPVAHTQEQPLEPAGEHDSEPPVPAASMARAAPHEDELAPEPQVEAHDPARAAGAHAAEATFGAGAVAAADPGAGVEGKSARVEYDYEKAEDNELELKEGEIIINIDMVDEDWWMGQNSRGETGLFPSNYVELLPDAAPVSAPVSAPAAASHAGAAPAPPPAAPAPAAAAQASGPTASAEYDYEAAEDNELSFPEGATIQDISFPDEDWWFGHYQGKSGLFPANYVKLNE